MAKLSAIKNRVLVQGEMGPNGAELSEMGPNGEKWFRMEWNGWKEAPNESKP